MSKEYQFRKIPTQRIRPNPKNPRKVYQPGLVEAMEASLRALGQLTAMKVRDLSEAERAQDPDHDVEVMGGDIRLAGGLRAGLPTMDCQVYTNLTPDEAELIGDMDNKDHNMVWLAWYEAIERRLAKPDQPSQDQVGKEMEVSQQLVSQAVKTLKYLNPASRAMIYHSVVKPDEDYEVSPKMVLKLADLTDPQKVESALKVAIHLKMTEPEAKKLVEWVQAGNPPETYTGQKTTKNTKAKKDPGIPLEVADKLIELSEQVGFAKGRGEDPTPAQDKLKAYRDSLTVTGKPLEPSHPITSPVGFTLLKQAVRDRVGKLVQKAGNVEPVAGHGAAPQAKTSNSKSLKWFEKTAHWFVKIVWHWMIKSEHKVCKKLAHAIVPLHTSHSSGTHSGHSHHRSNSLSQGLMTLSLTILHWVVYTLLQFVFLWSAAMWFTSHWLTGLKPWVEVPFRFTARLALVDFPAWAWNLALSHIIPAIVVGVLLLWGYTYAWKTQRARMTILALGLFLFVYYGRRWSEETTPEPQPAPVVQAASTPEAQALISKGLGQPNLAAHFSGTDRHAASQQTPKKEMGAAYQPSISFQTAASPADSTSAATLYDPKLLEQEIAALPQNCMVKSFPVLTDEGMPGDLAVSRMQGVTDPDKYTMMIGSGKEKIISINTTTTNLIINYKSTDPFSILDSAGPLNFFWEDVLYIHTDEIDVEGKTPYQFYQLSLVVSGSKYALTIQCSTVDDLKHLVSTMQYFIRNSRLGHDTALAGMPYPSQGLALNNDGVVEKLWAESPMDKAGVTLGDHLWSVGKVTAEKQSRNDLEAGLRSVPVTFFAASPAEWNRALIARDPARANSFRPKLRKVVLTGS